MMEADGISSAIRMVDIFYVPENFPDSGVINFFIYAAVKTKVPAASTTVQFKATAIDPEGKRSKLQDPKPLDVVVFNDDPSVPTGSALILNANIHPKKMGTHYVEVEANGELIGTVPFTLRRPERQAESLPEHTN